MNHIYQEREQRLGEWSWTGAIHPIHVNYIGPVLQCTGRQMLLLSMGVKSMVACSALLQWHSASPITTHHAKRRSDTSFFEAVQVFLLFHSVLREREASIGGSVTSVLFPSGGGGASSWVGRPGISDPSFCCKGKVIYCMLRDEKTPLCVTYGLEWSWLDQTRWNQMWTRQGTKDWRSFLASSSVLDCTAD